MNHQKPLRCHTGADYWQHFFAEVAAHSSALEQGVRSAIDKTLDGQTLDKLQVEFPALYPLNGGDDEKPIFRRELIKHGNMPYHLVFMLLERGPSIHVIPVRLESSSGIVIKPTASKRK